MDDSSAIGRVLQQVRRRTLTQLFLEHGNLALIVSLGALALMILLGTQVMDWYVPVLLLLLFLGVGWFRLRGSIPSDYQIAQAMDDRLGLNDSLSTAFYFASPELNSHHAYPASIVDAQRRQAESAAGSADPIAAAPMHLPRSIWATTALVAVSLGLLIARYGLRGSLDLTQPLVHIPFDSFLSQPEVVAKRELTPKQKLPPGVETVAVPADLDSDSAAEKKNSLDPEGVKAESTAEAGDPEGRAAQQSKSDEPAGKDGPAGEAGDKGEGKAGEQQDQSQKSGGANTPGKEGSKSPQSGQQNSGQQQQGDSSMMDKMRDAMANMLARMRMSPRANEGAQKNMSANQGQAQGAAAKQQAGQKGAPTPGKAQGQGEQASDQEGEQQGEGASKNMNASNRTDGVSDKQSPQEGKSGAGKQDGEKDIKAAEEAAAMGKISELLGKRAKDLTGEVMVEVSSGRQQLKTQMTQRNAQHADTGGEINRDEVPAAYQQFVQQYFEELRKPTAAPAAPAAPAAAQKPPAR